MLGLELLEFHYFDDLLADMKLTPVRFSTLASTSERREPQLLVPCLNRRFQGLGVRFPMEVLNTHQSDYPVIRPLGLVFPKVAKDMQILL